MKESENKPVKKTLNLSLRFYIYYFLFALTFCYLYLHKFVQKADLNSKFEPGGILAVLNFESFAPIQWRILTAYLYKILSFPLFFMSPPMIYFILIIISAVLIIVFFYLILNKYFEDKNINAWLAPVILFPACWNLIILNGQFFNYDFTLLLIMVVGYYFVINDNKILLLGLTILGTANHDTIVFIIAAFFIYNFFKMKKPAYFIPFILYLVIYVAGILILQQIFKDNPSDYTSKAPRTEHFFFFKVFMNMGPFVQLPLHIIFRDILLNFGGLFTLTVLMLRNTRLINLKHELIYIFLLIPAYFLGVFYRAGIEEMRNYSAIIPFITILFLVYFSRLKNSFLNIKPELRKEIPS